MTVSNIISTISAVDLISIHDKNGNVAFDGICSDFRATCSRANELLNEEVSRIRAFNNVIIILL